MDLVWSRAVIALVASLALGLALFATPSGAGDGSRWNGPADRPRAAAPATGNEAPASATAAVEGAAAPAYGTYAWPVRGRVIRGFDPPATPYGSGHRGIDIAAAPGTPVLASADGRVAFAGPIGGALYVSVDHPDGVRTTYSWVSELLVRAGDEVERGQAIARSGGGHDGVEPAHLHFGARIGSTYIDPMLLLQRGSVVGLVRLAPLEEA